MSCGVHPAKLQWYTEYGQTCYVYIFIACRIAMVGNLGCSFVTTEDSFELNIYIFYFSKLTTHELV